MATRELDIHLLHSETHLLPEHEAFVGVSVGPARTSFSYLAAAGLSPNTARACRA